MLAFPLCWLFHSARLSLSLSCFSLPLSVSRLHWPMCGAMPDNHTHSKEEGVCPGNELWSCRCGSKAFFLSLSHSHLQDERRRREPCEECRVRNEATKESGCSLHEYADSGAAAAVIFDHRDGWRRMLPCEGALACCVHCIALHAASRWTLIPRCNVWMRIALVGV